MGVEPISGATMPQAEKTAGTVYNHVAGRSLERIAVLRVLTEITASIDKPFASWKRL